MARRLTFGVPGARGARALELRLEGLTLAQIGQRMGCTWGTAASMIHVTKKRLGICVPRPTRAQKPEVCDAAIDRTAGCRACGLRGEHECLRGDATARRAAE